MKMDFNAYEGGTMSFGHLIFLNAFRLVMNRRPSANSIKQLFLAPRARTRNF
jgi:hypothetical protein